MIRLPRLKELTEFGSGRRKLQARQKVAERAEARKGLRFARTRQGKRRLLFEEAFADLQRRHGPEGRRRLRAMARSLSHRQWSQRATA